MAAGFEDFAHHDALRLRPAPRSSFTPPVGTARRRSTKLARITGSRLRAEARTANSAPVFRT
jgi:hypothetical protein